MTVDTMPRPVGEETETEADGVEHLVCCDPDRTLCGLDVTDAAFSDDDDDDVGPVCALCEVLDDGDMSCPALFCRLRRRWRERS